jgi:hypothetical protein
MIAFSVEGGNDDGPRHGPQLTGAHGSHPAALVLDLEIHRPEISFNSF